MPDTTVWRPHFRERQIVGEALLNLEQTYNRDLRRRLNLGHHTRGIFAGLELYLDSSQQLFLLPGLAIDVYGREIVVLSTYQFDPKKFSTHPANATVPIWIGYDWGAGSLPGAAGQPCDDPAQYDVIQETFILRSGKLSGSPHGQITVDGRDAQNDAPLPSYGDESFPDQELPTDDESLASWLLLGTVTLDSGKNFHSVEMSGREVGGVIAGSVLAPTHELLVAPRVINSGDTDYQQSFAEIDGALTVDYDLAAGTSIYLTAGKGSLQFQDSPTTAAGGDTFGIRRVSKTKLRVEIGQTGDSFAVGTGSKDLLNVDFDGTVSVAAGGELDFKGNATIDANGNFTSKATNQFKWQAGSAVTMSLTNSGDLTVMGNATVGKDFAVTGDLNVGGATITLPAAAAWIVSGGVKALGFDPSVPAIETGTGWALQADKLSPVGTHITVAGDLEILGALKIHGSAMPALISGVWPVNSPPAGVSIAPVQFPVPANLAGVPMAMLVPSLGKVNISGHTTWHADVGGPVPGFRLGSSLTWQFDVVIDCSNVASMTISYLALFYP